MNPFSRPNYPSLHGLEILLVRLDIWQSRQSCIGHGLLPQSASRRGAIKQNFASTPFGIFFPELFHLLLLYYHYYYCYYCYCYCYYYYYYYYLLLLLSLLFLNFELIFFFFFFVYIYVSLTCNHTECALIQTIMVFGTELSNLWCKRKEK